MSVVKHPAAYITPQLFNTIRTYAAEGEQLQQLHPMQLQIIHQEKWFNLFVPKEFNGLGLSLPEGLQKEEALAYTDGSLGWTVTLCAGAAWFIGFLKPELVQLIFSNKKACLAGSGQANGSAYKTKNRYLVNGKWDYATGAPFATAFTANCVLFEHDKPLLDKVGNPLIQSFLFLKNEITIVKNWKRIGMIATGSNGFSVAEVQVPENRTFIIDGKEATLSDPIFQYPFMALAQTTLAVNSSGMAMRFLDICKEDLSADKYKLLQQKLLIAYAEMDTSRQLFFEAVATSWKQCIEQKLTAETLHIIGELSKQLAHKSLKITDELYPYCGMNAANPSTELNRVWRNMHTASQHSIFNV